MESAKVARVSYRAPADVAAEFETFPREGKRTISDNHRSALAFVTAVLHLAQLWADSHAAPQAVKRAKTRAGHELLPMLPREIRDAFYESRGLTGEPGRYEVPVDELLSWIVGIPQSVERDPLSDFAPSDLAQARAVISRALEQRNG